MQSILSVGSGLLQMKIKQQALKDQQALEEELGVNKLCFKNENENKE